MSYRSLTLGIAAATIIALSTVSVVAQQAPASPGTAAAGANRTPWGEPDLQGIWSAGTLTPMERPARWAGKPVLTPEEAAAYEAEHAKDVDLDERAFGRRADDSYNNAFAPYGGGTAEMLNGGRTSLIVDPPDGKIPPFSPDGVTRENTYREWLRMLVTGSVGGIAGPISSRRNDPPPVYNTGRTNAASDPESRGTRERCFSQPLPYETSPATFVRIVQSQGAISLFVETHQGHGHVRTVNIGRSHLPSHIRLIHGDSVARWEGDTLVIDTTNFTAKMEYQGARENLHIVERLTRTSDGRLSHRVTLEDPTTWTKPWTYEVDWSRLPDTTNHYEQSCHEGNFGIIGQLSGRRHVERLYEQGKTYNPEFLNIGGGSGPALIGPDGVSIRAAVAID